MVMVLVGSMNPPHLPGNNCRAHGALNDVPPMNTDSEVSEVAVVAIGKSVEDWTLYSARCPAEQSMVTSPDSESANLPLLTRH